MFTQNASESFKRFSRLPLSCSHRRLVCHKRKWQRIKLGKYTIHVRSWMISWKIFQKVFFRTIFMLWFGIIIICTCYDIYLYNTDKGKCCSLMKPKKIFSYAGKQMACITRIKNSLRKMSTELPSCSLNNIFLMMISYYVFFRFHWSSFVGAYLLWM